MSGEDTYYDVRGELSGAREREGESALFNVLIPKFKLSYT